jgi:hypothetical protein
VSPTRTFRLGYHTIRRRTLFAAPFEPDARLGFSTAPHEGRCHCTVSPEVVIRKAVEKGVRLYATKDSAFDVVGRLYALGLRGKQD